MNRRQFVMSTAIGTLSLSLTTRVMEAAQATPATEGDDAWVSGNAFELLATEGDPDTLSPVVEPVMFDNSTYAVVLRNFYSQPIAISDVYGMVRDGQGSLLATVETGYYAPAIIEPNGISIVCVEFDTELSNSERREAEVELDYDSSTDIAESYNANLAVTDFSVRADRVIGVVENTTGAELSIGWVVAVWFDDDGQLVSWFSTTTEKWDIPAGDTSTFSQSLNSGGSFSDLPYLVASRASSF